MKIILAGTNVNVALAGDDEIIYALGIIAGIMERGNDLGKRSDG